MSFVSFEQCVWHHGHGEPGPVPQAVVRECRRVGGTDITEVLWTLETNAYVWIERVSLNLNDQAPPEDCHTEVQMLPRAREDRLRTSYKARDHEHAREQGC